MKQLTFHLILHTHWDREWYRPRAGFLPRLVDAVDDALHVLDRDEDARFTLDGQTVLIEDACAVHPAWRSRLASQVAHGRLEVGPWYILADELLPAGESVIRNLLQGTSDARSLGRRMDVLYSPDAFGHPAALPTLAGEFGIRHAVIWRGLGTTAEGTDRDLWWWVGPDGSRTLLYHLPQPGYEIGAELAGAPETLGQRWRAIRHSLVRRSTTAHVAVFVGADHHAPVALPVGLRDGIRELEPDHVVRLSGLEEFFAAVESSARDLPTVRGELRRGYGFTWALQGTHATRARMKRRHGMAELQLQRGAEAISAVAWVRDRRDHRPLLQSAWRTLLQCQFHDTICGCSSDLVAREQDVRLTSVIETSRALIDASLDALTSHSSDRAREMPESTAPCLMLWNPVARRRREIVTASMSFFRQDVLVGPPAGRIARRGPGSAPFALVAGSGQPIAVQVLSTTAEMERVEADHHYPNQDEVDRMLVAFVAPPVEGLGVCAAGLAPPVALIPEPRVTVRGHRIISDLLEVSVEADGRIAMRDRRSGLHFPDLLQLVDERDDGDTYTPSINSGATPAPQRDLKVRVLATGPLVAAMELRFTLAACGGTLDCRLILVMHADSLALRVRLEVDNRALNHRLRIRIPVGAGTEVTAGAAFGAERRGPGDAEGDDHPGETPERTAPAHRYVAAASGTRGLAVVSPGFMEYEWTRSQDLLVTAFRAVGELSRDDLLTRPGHAGWPMPTPEAQELGGHVIDLAIVPVDAAAVAGIQELEEHWEDVFLPLQSRCVRAFSGAFGATPGGVTLEGRGLVFSACKLADQREGIMLRCYNVTDEPAAGRWTFAQPIDRALLCRADETVLGCLQLSDRGAVDFVAPPRGLVSIIVVSAAARADVPGRAPLPMP